MDLNDTFGAETSSGSFDSQIPSESQRCHMQPRVLEFIAKEHWMITDRWDACKSNFAGSRFRRYDGKFCTIIGLFIDEEETEPLCVHYVVDGDGPSPSSMSFRRFFSYVSTSKGINCERFVQC